jgi:hypothetical protein
MLGFKFKFRYLCQGDGIKIKRRFVSFKFWNPDLPRNLNKVPGCNWRAKRSYLRNPFLLIKNSI